MTTLCSFVCITSENLLVPTRDAQKIILLFFSVVGKEQQNKYFTCIFLKFYYFRDKQRNVTLCIRVRSLGIQNNSKTFQTPT